MPASETAPPLDDPSTKEVSAGLPALKLLLGGPVFLFGEVTGSEQAARSTDATKVVGVTGLSWTLPVENLAELQLSCGPLLTYASQPAATHDRSNGLPIQADPLRIAVQCRWPLLAGVKLESQSVATPAFSDQERDTMSQDLRVVLPVGGGGQLQLGAKRSWETLGETKTLEATQFYGGFWFGW